MRLAIYIRSVESARGAEKVSAIVARGLARQGHAVDFLVEDEGGWLIDDVRAASGAVRVVNLNSGSEPRWVRRWAQVRAIAAALMSVRRDDIGRSGEWLGPLLRLVARDDPPILALTRYLARERPHAILSFLNYPNIVLLIAAALCRRPSRVIVNVRNQVSAAAEHAQSKWASSVPALMRRFFRTADLVVAPSTGVAADVGRITGLPQDRIRLIYNPVFHPEITELASRPADHAWLAEGRVPVVLGVGKLKQQKDFPTLLRAFRRVRDRRDARLIILGEGSERSALSALVGSLGLAGDVDLPGQVQNPYAYYARASVFVLSSRWEGLPNVLIEAMACGCPVVSTDCPSGPVEILNGGTFGTLVPMGDDEAMAAAIEATLASPPPAARLVEQARHFSEDAAIRAYEAAMISP